jgi:hypothetical protein
VGTAGGLARTQRFFRYFLMAGVGHCFAGDNAGADVFDSLADITAWVENGRAPDRIIVQKLKQYTSLFPDVQLPTATENVLFSRPLYPFPLRVVYAGKGDSDLAVNFRARAPVQADPGLTP